MVIDYSKQQMVAGTTIFTPGWFQMEKIEKKTTQSGGWSTQNSRSPTNEHKNYGKQKPGCVVNKAANVTNKNCDLTKK